MKMNENKNANVYVPKKKIQKEIIQEEGIKAKQLMDDIKQSEVNSVQRREQLFKKNMGMA